MGPLTRLTSLGAALIGVALIWTGAAVAESSGDVREGRYACANPGGNKVKSRSFAIVDGTSYGRSPNAPAGSYRIDGLNVIFTGGPFAGRSALRLPDGRLKLGEHTFCSLVPEPATETAASVPDTAPDAADTSGPKLIKVDGAPDPRLVSLGR